MNVSDSIESATSNLDSVLGRVDRVMRGIEDGTRGITSAVGGFGDFISNLRPPAHAGGGASGSLAAMASLLTLFWQAWSHVTERRPAQAAGDGGAHRE